MPVITLLFNFINDDKNSTQEQEFDLESGIQDFVDEAVEATLEQLGEGWELEDYEQCYLTGFKESWELDADFNDLEHFAEFAERVEKNECYEARAYDIGDVDFDFDEHYNGCWDSVEDFVQNLVEDCYSLDLPTFLYVDWERTARDVMMDYSEYHDIDGVHIFRS